MQGNEEKAFKMLEKDARGEFDDLDVINYSYKRYIKGLIRSLLVPKKMNPKKEEWEKLGFVFENIDDDKTLYKATLPENWQLAFTDNLNCAEILDNNNLKRGFIHYNNYSENSHMILESRYDIYSDYIDNKHAIKEVYFGNPDEKLFIAGQVELSNPEKAEYRAQAYHYEERLKALAKEFATAYYPNWHNINAYWEVEEKVKVRK